MASVLSLAPTHYINLKERREKKKCRARGGLYTCDLVNDTWPINAEKGSCDFNSKKKINRLHDKAQYPCVNES